MSSEKRTEFAGDSESEMFTNEVSGERDDVSVFSGETKCHIKSEVEKSSPCAQDVINSNNLDKLTLELLMNKRQYRKYIEKHNPDEYTKKQADYDRLMKYKPQIAHFIQELLNDYSISGNSEHLGNLDIQDSFQALLNSCVYFFETRDYDNRGPADTLFSSEHMTDTSNRKEPPVLSGSFANVYRTGNSFWGKSISKRQ